MIKARVQLKDIAQRLGLTINTVSRSLKDADDISYRTKELVKETAHEMGYIPDIVARSLRSGETKTIGVMFDNLSNPYYMMMTQLIHDQIKELGYDLMVFTSSGDHSQFDLISFKKMIARGIDGIITFLKPTREVANFVKLNNIPLVILGRSGKDVGIDSVDTDDFQGGYLTGKHLIEKGHKKIGYLGVPKDIECSLMRYQGLTKAMDEFDIVIDDKNAKFLNDGELDIIPYVNQLIDQDISAIFCFNDGLAFEVIDLIQERGFRVPDDIAIVGYDNIQSVLKLPLKLTTIASNKETVAKGCVDILMNKMVNNDMNKIISETYEVSLIERKTT